MSPAEDVRPQSGSCFRCRRALDLASAKVGGRWYGSEACAGDGPCPLESRSPAVPEPWLYPRPKRFFGRRGPKELRGGAGAAYQDASASK